MKGFGNLLEGYRRFRSNRVETERERWKELAEGQSPRAIIIACCDSRADPALIFDAARRAARLARSERRIADADFLHRRAAENAAAECLRANGFRVLWQNLRIGPLEIDLVALKGDLAVVVDVGEHRRRSFAPVLGGPSEGGRAWPE